ncbi:valine--tRNA ligase [Leptolyngbya cf. ectocarpi LEGE 11479]|uniref:Valine--tRNA ligase n=1 Tax=Leptolyngbya cf. ectocarpi LEGE 11479 TaxID=1828722 RepID=A0A928ZTJ6_LEPEC|nr:valine--tRNA ligase [Leptolyngbya ectocarpi]MBE9065819.1 valine--tRNA ligase [Leptolyngbya cf. ectocarpi LEGE 11479]
MTATVPNLSSQYDPSQTESKWQSTWEDKAVFKADPNHGGEPFCVVIPPPNVTGSLHMGHAFENALIDTLVRYQRMNGRNTLWLPGTDHASIAVSAILDKELRSQNKTRQDISRDDYLQRAWQWKEESGGTIVNQLRKLGVSVDWTRERFTMDEGLTKAVLKAFNQLYQEGLIYRGNYMVNWCPASQSAVSDVEVENKDVDGSLWHFRYPLTDGSGYVEVATTRPETMLGDTAVAVSPEDERYLEMVGKTLTLPLVGREIPIIADSYVDKEFGTGCVKVTPAHDPNDFAMGERHNLPLITIMNKDGSMNENAGRFEGLDRFEARTQVVAALDDVDALVRIEDYQHSVPYSDRGKVPIEPLLSTQWFVKIRPMADMALDALDNHQSPKFVPERWTKVYRDWLVNLRDWCISRQLWWGHQIPAWYAVSQTNGEITDSTPFFVAESEDEARASAIKQFGDDVELKQDPDVLDTWFSSGLWPFSTMGWPDENAKDFQTYYPTTTLVTGFDIIFFWVARMTMMAGHFTDTMPFETVYIHGLVRDEKNQKMSKSKGNGIDPLVLINKYGTDALRYTLIREVAGAGQDIRLDYNRKTDESSSVEASRNFTNKLWNASRFVMMNLGGQTPADLGEPDTAKLELADKWILSKFNQTINQTRECLNQYGMGEAAKVLYEFIWGDFCDWYIELVKPRLYGKDENSKLVAQQTLAFVLEGILKLLHPFTPHITEEVWHTLTQVGEDSYLAVQPYPTVRPELVDAKLEKDFDLLIGTIRTIRNLRAAAGVKPSAKIEAILKTDDANEVRILNATQVYLKDTAKVETLTISGTTLTAETLTVAETSGDQAPQISEKSDRADETDELPEIDWGDGVDAIQTLLKHPLGYIGQAYNASKKPASVVLLLLLTGLGLRLAAAVVTGISTLPPVGRFFQMIGVGYTTWFGGRYILKAENRRQLWENVIGFWDEVVGTLSTDSADAVEGLDVAAQTDEIAAADTRQMFAGVFGTVQVLIPLTGLVDVEALKQKIEKSLAKVEGEIKSISGRLGNQGFVNKAPERVVQETRDSLAEAETQAKLLRERLTML